MSLYRLGSAASRWHSLGEPVLRVGKARMWGADLPAARWDAIGAESAGSEDT